MDAWRTLTGGFIGQLLYSIACISVDGILEALNLHLRSEHIADFYGKPFSHLIHICRYLQFN